MSTGLTIKAFLHAQNKAVGPPSIEEVAAELKVSKTVARDRLQTCVEGGLMKMTRGKARSYRLTDSGMRIASTS